MTTTSYDHVATATEIGSQPNRWTDEVTLTSSTSGAAYVTSDGSTTGMRTLQLEVPDFMSTLPAGSEFVSMSIQFKAYVDTAQLTDYYNFITRQNGATVRTDDVDSTSTTTRTYAGDATYWGFSGSAQDIMEDLADGSIKWWFETKGVPSVATRRDLKNFQVQLTYAEPATEAALIPLIS